MGVEPFNILFVGPRGFNDLRNDDSQKYLEYMSRATSQRSVFDHPIFRGDCLLVDNTVVRIMNKPLQWKRGSQIGYSLNDRAATPMFEAVPNNVDVERGIFLGREALAYAYGKTSNGTEFKFKNEKYDGDDKERMFMSWIGGIAKVRFPNNDGYMTDNGVAVLDYAVTLPTAA